MKPEVGLAVPQMPPMSHITAEQTAIQIVSNYDRGLLESPRRFPADDFYEFHLVERYGLDTGTGDLPFELEGVTRPNGQLRLAPHVYEAMINGEDGRARLTPVHEAVHGIVHLPTLRKLNRELVDGGDTIPKLFRRQELPRFVNPEWQANRIAGAILMPFQAVKVVVAQHGMDPGALVRAFGVSRYAAETRLGQLQRMGWLPNG